MSAGPFELHGEVFVTFATAAECFRVELRFIEAVYATGLLGPGERIGDTIALAGADMDRLAEILRWHRHHGLDLEALTVLLGE